MILSRQRQKQAKGSPTSDTFFPVNPLQPNPHIPPAEEVAALGTAAGNPDQAQGCGLQVWLPPRRQGPATHGPSPCMGATLFPPGSSRKANVNAVALLHTHVHIHIPKPRKLWSSPLLPRGTWAATLLELSRRPPPETDRHPRWASPIAALENQLSNLTLHLQLERPA